MKTYILDVDFVMSKRIHVEADSEEQAMSIFASKMREYPYQNARGFDAYIGYRIIDVNEED